MNRHQTDTYMAFEDLYNKLISPNATNCFLLIKLRNSLAFEKVVVVCVSVCMCVHAF